MATQRAKAQLPPLDTGPLPLKGYRRAGTPGAVTVAAVRCAAARAAVRRCGACAAKPQRAQQIWPLRKPETCREAARRQLIDLVDSVGGVGPQRRRRALWKQPVKERLHRGWPRSLSNRSSRLPLQVLAFPVADRASRLCARPSSRRAAGCPTCRASAAPSPPPASPNGVNLPPCRAAPSRPQKRGKKVLVLDPSVSGPLTLLDPRLGELLTEHGVARWAPVKA